MNYYHSTFISGFQEIIVNALKNTLPDVEIKEILDGLVIYKTSSDVKTIQKLKFLNNSFVLLSHIINRKSSKKQNLEIIVQNLLKRSNFDGIKSITKLRYIKYFRVMVSKENETRSIKPSVLEQVEKKISRELRLKIHRSNPDIEFWFLARKEGSLLFGARITPLGKQKTRKYEKGELRRELAHLLVLMSDPSKDDVVLEPFAGSGAIVLERVQSFLYKKIYASDTDLDLAGELKRKTKWGQQKIVVLSENAFTLPSISDNSIDKIITDPPWGEFGPPLPSQVAPFNQEMLKSFDRVLKSNGVAVILLSRNIDFDSVVKNSAFQISKRVNILVSGKKATVYKLAKKKNT